TTSVTCPGRPTEPGSKPPPVTAPRACGTPVADCSGNYMATWAWWRWPHGHRTLSIWPPPHGTPPCACAPQTPDKPAYAPQTPPTWYAVWHGVPTDSVSRRPHVTAWYGSGRPRPGACAHS